MHHYRQALMRMRQGDSDRDIAKNGLMCRANAASLRTLAQTQGWLDGGATLPEDAAIAQVLATPKRASTTISGLEPLRSQIAGWLGQGVSGVVIHTALKREHGYTGSYSAVRRMLATLKRETPPEATVRLIFAPGEAAQVDFGAGPMLANPAGEVRRTWAFVMTLCFSRHQYVEFVWDQTVATWLGCHRRAFEWFGAVPARLIIDNAKCAIIKACRHDPQTQRSYADAACGYGFRIDACPPHDPQKKAWASYCTLCGRLNGSELGRSGTVASTLTLDEIDLADGFEEAAVLVAVAMFAQDSGVAPLIDGRCAHPELRRQFVGTEHATCPQAFIAALEMVGIANDKDFLVGEGFALPVLVAQRIELCRHLAVGAGLE